MATLIFRNGPYKSKSLRIPEGKNITMGRNRDIELPLPDLKLSRKHCVIEHSDDGYILRDLGSTNGTYINGKRVVGTSTLHNYDRILLGDTEIEFQCPEEFEQDATQVSVPNQERLEESARAPLIPFFNENADARTKSNNPPIAVPHGHDEKASPAPVLDPLTAALQDLDRPLPPEPRVPQKSMPRLLFCDECNVSIPHKDFDQGRARETEGRLICHECLNKKTAKSRPARQNIDEIIAQLDEVEEIVIDDELPPLIDNPSQKTHPAPLGRGASARSNMVRRGEHSTGPVKAVGGILQPESDAAITEFLEDDEFEEIGEKPAGPRRNPSADSAVTEIGESDH